MEKTDITTENPEDKLLKTQAEIEVQNKKIAEQDELIRFLTFHLGERKKELWCHNEITRVLDHQELSPDEVYQQVAEIIPGGLQFPDRTSCQIKIHDSIYSSIGFKQSDAELLCHINLQSKPIGFIKVCYLRDENEPSKNLFLPEEADLLNLIAQRLGHFTEKLEKESEIAIREEKNKQIETELKNRNLLYQSIIDASPDVITITDLEGKVEFTSPTAKEMFGAKDTDVFINHSMLEYIDPADHPKAINGIAQMLQGNLLGAEEYKAVRLDGTIFDCEVNGEFVRYENGHPKKMIFVTRDITSRKQAEASLRESEEKYRSLIESSDAAIMMLDPDGYYLYLNAIAAQPWGFSSGEMVGMHVGDLFPPDQAAFMMNDIRKVIVENAGLAVEGTVDVAGEKMWVRTSIQPVRNEAGIAVAVLMYANDITEAKLTEESNRKLSRAVEQSPVSIVIANLEGNIEYANPYACETTGYSLDELIGKNPRVFKSGETAIEEYDSMWSKISQGREWKGLLHNKRKNGELYWESSTIAPITDGKGNISHYVAIKEDITERKQIEREIRKLNLAIEQSPVSIVITDLDANILYVSPEFYKTTGYKAAEVIGQNSGILKSGLTSQVVYDDLWNMIKAGLPWQGEWINKKKNGDYYWESVSITPVHDENGTITSYLAIKQDISERKKSEQEIRELNLNLEEKIAERTKDLEKSNTELQKARVEADQANTAKSEFLSRMSHELRTPMNSILGFAQLLEMGDLNPGQLKGVKHVLKSGKHLLQLINEVLDISRIEAGHVSLFIEPVDLHGVLDELTDIVQPLASARQIKISMIEETDGNISCKSDKQRLKQVLINIINNAIKYNSDYGSVTIQTSIHRADKPENNRVRVAVTDTGPGIPADDIPKVFIPFERIGAEKTNTEGTGLGLAVVKKLMEAMGGLIGVESETGRGSTFWIELPQTESQSQLAEKTGVLPETRITTDRLQGTIFYIEDNVSNIVLIEHVLSGQRKGIQLVTEMVGKNAVAKAVACNPDLILLDLNLPDMHGSEVLGMLLTDERTKSIPVIIISADAMPHQLTKMLKAGARYYLTKPLDVMDFLKIVDQFIK